MARRIEDEFGHVQQLILIGKERGYLLYDEINDSLPVDVHSSQEIDDLMSILERQGIEIDGVDNSPEMLTLCRQKAEQILGQTPR